MKKVCHGTFNALGRCCCKTKAFSSVFKHLYEIAVCSELIIQCPELYSESQIDIQYKRVLGQNVEKSKDRGEYVLSNIYMK